MVQKCKEGKPNATGIMKNGKSKKEFACLALILVKFMKIAMLKVASAAMDSAAMKNISRHWQICPVLRTLDVM